MANAFDQFDSSSPAASTAANPFDQFDSPKKKEATWYNEIARQAALTARAAITGASALPNMVGGALNGGINLATSGINKVAGTNIPQLQMPAQATQELMNKAGVAQPQNATERVVQDIGAGMAGGAGASSLSGLMARNVANPTVQNVAARLAENPTMQIGAGASGAGAAGTTREAGGGTMAQLAAGVAGSLAPGAAGALPGVARTVLGGGAENAATIADRTQTMNDAGVARPSIGQATGNRNAQAFESLLAKTPGGAGVMANAAKNQAEDIGARATQVADKLSSIGNPANAGLAIEKGIAGPDGFISRFKDAQKALYAKVDQYIPKDSSIDVSKTKGTLASMNSDIKGAPAISQWFKNSKIQGIEEALKSDTGGTPAKNSAVLQQNGQPFQTGAVEGKNVLPYDAVKQLRTLVGAELENPSLMTDVPRSKWKALYASLSQDMDKAAVATGNPEAIKAAKRAASFTKAGYDRIENVLDKVVGKNTPEQIFKTATSPADMEAGATKIASIMKSLEPTERDVVKSAFIRRMGRATAGNQDADGSVFSPQTFLTNWNKMSPQAKSVMFSGKDGETAQSLNQIARAAQYLKEGSKVFSNPSGTSQGAAQIGVASGVSAAAATGHIGTAAMLLGGVAAANISAKAMTNPAFSRWLAGSTQLNPGAIPAALNTLNKVMNDQDDDVKAQVQNFSDAVKNQIKNAAPAPTSAPLSQLVQNSQSQQ